MSENKTTGLIQPELTDLHAGACMLMTQFINGRHCPKLAHLIVQQLGRMLTHPELGQISASRNIYQQLLEHWQKVSSLLLEQQTARQRQGGQYH